MDKPMIHPNAGGLYMRARQTQTGNAHAKTDAEQMVCGALVMPLLCNL
jgi:hypothetical protein